MALAIFFQDRCNASRKNTYPLECVTDQRFCVFDNGYLCVVHIFLNDFRHLQQDLVELNSVTVAMPKQKSQ